MKHEDLMYSKDHLWVYKGKEQAYIGLSAYASKELGRVVYTDLGISQRVVKSGETMGTVESVKTVSDLICPFDCEIVDVNVDISAGALESHPEELSGWLYLVRTKPGADWREGLMTAPEYEKYTGGGNAADKT